MRNDLQERAKRVRGALLSYAGHFFDKNLWLRVLAIVAAIIMWVVVVQGDTSKRKATLYDIPIEVTGWEQLEASGLVLVENLEELLPDTVNVRLEGTKEEMEALIRDEVRVVVDLSRVKGEGARVLPLEVQNAGRLAPTVQKITGVTVTAKERLETTVPVKIEFTGSAADGYLEDKNAFTADPPRLKIFGSGEDLAEIKSARVTVDLSGLSSDVEGQYGYVFLDEHGRELNKHAVDASAQSVIVTGPVYYTMLADVMLTPGALTNPGYMVNLDKYEYSAVLATDQVLVCGDEDELKRYFAENGSTIYLLAALVDETTVATKSQSVQSNIPGLKKCVPDRVEVTYTMTERMEHVPLAHLRINIHNPPEGVTITLDPDYLDYAIFTVPITKAPYVNRDAIEAYVDLSAFGVGEHTVPVYLRQVASNDVVSLDDVAFDRSIKVTITPDGGEAGP